MLLKKIDRKVQCILQRRNTGRSTVKGRTLDKLRTFKMFKNNYKMESYISLKVDKHLTFESC